MAVHAAARAIEIHAAGFRVTGLKVGDLHGTAPAAQGFSYGLLIVNESGNRFEIRVIQIKRRHSLVGAAGSHDGTDLVSADIFRNQRRSGKIGTGFPAGSIASMAEAALRREAALASLHLFAWIRLRRRRPRRTLRYRTGRPSRAIL